MSIESYLQFYPTIPQSTFVHRHACVIGKVTLGEDVSVWPKTVIRGDVNDIHIGDRTNIQDGSILHVTSPSPENPAGFPLLIGNEVTIGHRVLAHACTIGDRCLIGMGSIIMDGAVLEKDSILAAGSLVPPGKELVSGFLWMGNPVRKKRPLENKEYEYIVHLAAHYVVLKNNYLRPPRS